MEEMFEWFLEFFKISQADNVKNYLNKKYFSHNQEEYPR